jgi:hypothetical protein
MSVYQPGYERWEQFDNLPEEVRQAHNIVWTGYVWNLDYISTEDAKAIIELDRGKHMLEFSDVLK